MSPGKLSKHGGSRGLVTLVTLLLSKKYLCFIFIVFKLVYISNLMSLMSFTTGSL